MAAKWIQKAIKKPGALRKELGVKKGKNSCKKVECSGEEKWQIGTTCPTCKNAGETSQEKIMRFGRQILLTLWSDNHE